MQKEKEAPTPTQKEGESSSPTTEALLNQSQKEGEPSSPTTETLLNQYGQVCTTYHAIDDFRSKLLALLPFASGVGWILLLADANTSKQYLLPIGILGAVITFGLFVFEARGAQRCDGIKSTARALETALGLNHSTGQFTGMPKPILGLVREFVAGILVYTAVFAGWVALALHGAGII